MEEQTIKSEIVYKNYRSFNILGKEVNLFSEKINDNRYTIAEVDGIYNHIGDEMVGLSTAILIIEQQRGAGFDDNEMRQILIDNNIISEAI